MTVTDIVISYLISVTASKTESRFPLFRQSLEGKFNSSFKKALKRWLPQQQLDLKEYKIEGYWDLINYLDPTQTETPKELHALADLWIRESLNDSECAHFIGNLKQDIMLGKLAETEEKLSQLSERQAQIPLSTTPTVTAHEKATAPSDTFKRNKDLKTLTELMEAFSFDLLEDYLKSDPHTVRLRVSDCFDAWYYTIESSKFKIYDTGLRKVITDFYKKWAEAMNTGFRWYFTRPGTDLLVFEALKNDIFIPDEAEEAFEKLVKLHLEMLPLLKDMSDYIQDNYEIDLDDCALKFFS